MQGYILSVQKQKNEDVIVRILTPTQVKTLYRFYGSRHPIVHIGRKIDFTQEHNGLFMPKLRNVMHLGFIWEREAARLYVWQRFCALLHQHLRDVSRIDERYFAVIDSGAKRLSRQNPKRVALEMYAQILSLEGRLPRLATCCICEQPLDSPPREAPLESKAQEPPQKAPATPLSMLRGFLGAHRHCVQAPALPYEKLASYVRSASTIELDDREVECAYQVLLLGL